MILSQGWEDVCTCPAEAVHSNLTQAGRIEVYFLWRLETEIISATDS
jgi:hypothetical protein